MIYCPGVGAFFGCRNGSQFSAIPNSKSAARAIVLKGLKIVMIIKKITASLNVRDRQTRKKSTIPAP
jgi:hypothetical protein